MSGSVNPKFRAVLIKPISLPNLSVELTNLNFDEHKINANITFDLSYKLKRYAREIMGTLIYNKREHLRFAKYHGENYVVYCQINDLLGVEFLTTVCKLV